MIQKNNWFRGDETGCDWFCKHSVWISKRTLGRTPIPPAVEKGESENVFYRNGFWHNDRRSLWYWTDVLCGCWKERRSADGADADTQTETGRTKTDPVPRYGRVGTVLPFGWGKSLHDGGGRNEGDWDLPLCG